MRAPNNRILLAAATALLAALAGRAVAEEFDPAKVPWDQIEAWAAGKSQENPFKAGAHPAPPPAQPQPQPPPGDPKKTEQPPEAAKPDPAVKNPVRHVEPVQIAMVRAKAQAALDDEIREATRFKDFPRMYRAHFRHDQYDLALQDLVQVASDTKRYQDAINSAWLYESFWQTGLLAKQRPSQQMLDKAFQDWDQKLGGEKDKDQNWKNWYNGQKEYYTNAARYLAQAIDLENKGESDPAALWQVVDRFQASKPASNVRYIAALYRLREWYPEFQQVQSGEVQWRLVDRLHNQLNVEDMAAEEAQTLLTKYPKHWSAEGGEVLWKRAEAIHWQANGTPNGPKRTELYEEARRTYMNYQQRFPGKGYNTPKPPGDPNAGKTECGMRLEDVNNKLPKR